MQVTLGIHLFNTSKRALNGCLSYLLLILIPSYMFYQSGQI